MSKRPYRLFTSCEGDWHMGFAASYASSEAAEKSARKKITSHDDILSPITEVMVVDSETGEMLFRGKR